MKFDNKKLEKLMMIEPEIMTIYEEEILLKELTKSQLYLPIEIVSDSFDFENPHISETITLDEPLKFKPIKIYDDNNSVILPLFTSSEKFKESGIQSSTIVIYTEDLANMLKDADEEYNEIIINPSNKYSMSIYLNSFLDLFIEDINDNLLDLIEVFDEKMILIKENQDYIKRIPTPEMKRIIPKIYNLLDKISPVNFDCGKLCGEVCCVYDIENKDSDELVLYLLPGEELMYGEDNSFELYHLDSKEIKYPHSWKDNIYLVKCINPPKCNRSIRPIQCRTFPLIPHLSKNGEFHLIFDESEFPYECPLIHDNIDLNSEFIEITYFVWTVLICNPLVYDLVDMDSRIRDNRKIEYEIVI